MIFKEPGSAAQGEGKAHAGKLALVAKRSCQEGTLPGNSNYRTGDLYL